MKHREDLIEAYMGRYEITREEAIIMINRETPKERLATYLEWNGIHGYSDAAYEIATCAHLASNPREAMEVYGGKAEQGPVKIADEKGVYPNALDKAIAEQAEYYKGRSPEEVLQSQNDNFKGYHKFRNPETGEEYGSFEVHYVDQEVPTAEEPIQPGWYWRSCFPGCLPDGDDHGPFPTAEGAYLDAIEE